MVTEKSDATSDLAERETFEARTPDGALVGWVTGVAQSPDRRVLLLHGGPGLSYEYLAGIAADIGDGWRIAAFQQRGLEPSTLGGQLDIATAVDDVVAVLDALGWSQAVVLGHSWGGHLALHLAVSIPERLLAVACVDLLGAVGDGGLDQFSTELAARMTPAAQEAMAALEAEAATEGTADQISAEALRIMWPSYFSTPMAAPDAPATRVNDAAAQALFADLIRRMPQLQTDLPGIRTPLLIQMGASSPMPLTAGSDVVDLVPGAVLQVVPNVGHFTWMEAPGCIRDGLAELALMAALA